MLLHVDVIIKTEIEESNYVEAAARIRHITKAELFRRILKASIQDQMVGAILDDIKWEEGIK